VSEYDGADVARENAMSILVVDETLTTRLEKADGPVEICARDGRRLGFFTPGPPRQYNLEPQISEDELRRREQDTGAGHTTAEVLARLRSL
jgi:hypothetical protein